MTTPLANVNPPRIPNATSSLHHLHLPLFTICSFTNMSFLPNASSSLIDRPFRSSLPTSSSILKIALPHNLNPALSPIPAPSNEVELFQEDDLEFRTITTMLRTLGARDRVTVDNFQVSTQYRRDLKLLTALSSLLVRDCEIIAVMPKRSARGTILFVGTTAEDPTEKDFSDVESNSSSGSSSSVESFVTRNPEYQDPVGPVALLESPMVHLDSDIFEFISQNWNQSFDHHVQSFASLLNKALANPHDGPAREALDLYSTFQSIPKICRRFRNSHWVNALLELQPHFNVAHVPSPEDQAQIDAVLSANKGATSNSLLYNFLENPPADQQQWLPEFHSFFLWFLRILRHQIKNLTKLRSKKNTPQGLSESQIKDAYGNLGVLQYFSWGSPFFADYISEVFAPRIRDPHDIGVPLSSELEDDPQMSEGEPEEEEIVDNMGLDIATEFETDEERALVTTPGEDTHPCILELRLISSNIQNIDRLIRRTPRTRFRFQVIQYPPAGRSLMPWRKLIQLLFPNPERRTVILQALADTPGKEFDYFRPDGDILTFKGQAHCEAVLGCLFSLTKRGEDNTWTGIPQSVLDAIGTCYSLLAPSKRCCPVCATIISFLSEEAVEAGGTGIHALSKHSITFPCALPVGLPSSIRRKLLDKYRLELRRRLGALTETRRSSSGGSAQSATLSHDGDSEAKPTAVQQRLLDLYKRLWPGLNDEERKTKWERLGRSLTPEQLASWWAEMSAELKVGLTPPEGVEQPALTAGMANLDLQLKAQA